MQHTQIITAPSLTWAQQQAGELSKARASVEATVRLSPEAYNEILFEHGCRFAEEFSKTCMRRQSVKKSLLEDAAWGFWPWFRMKYMMDDAAILKTGNDMSHRNYLHLKSYMVGDELFEKELFHLVNHLL